VFYVSSEVYVAELLGLEGAGENNLERSESFYSKVCDF